MTDSDRQLINEWLMRQGPSNCWTGTSGALAAAVHRLLAERDRCADLLPSPRCPCCDETDACVEGCTYTDDDPVGFEAMQAVRGAMKGGE